MDQELALNPRISGRKNMAILTDGTQITKYDFGISVGPQNLMSSITTACPARKAHPKPYDGRMAMHQPKSKTHSSNRRTGTSRDRNFPRP